MKILTIIIPAYNIEKYISRCINSVVNSKYFNKLEVIIINDGSTDNTQSIAEDFIHKYPETIKVINKKNGGHGSAINRGIIESTGRYFKVLDGDDWFDTKKFDIFIDKLLKSNSDLIITNYSKQLVEDNKIENIKIDFLKEGIIYNILPNERIPMHCITYKTDILKNNKIALSEGIFYVDIQYTIYPMKYIKTYEYYNIDLYQYFLGRLEQSMTIENRVKRSYHHLLVTKSIIDYYSENMYNNSIKKMMVETLQYLINMQYLISYLKNKNNLELNELYIYIKNSNYNYKFEFNKKISYILHFNEKTNKLFSKLVCFIVDKLLKNKKL